MSEFRLQAQVAHIWFFFFAHMWHSKILDETHLCDDPSTPDFNPASTNTHLYTEKAAIAPQKAINKNAFFFSWSLTSPANELMASTAHQLMNGTINAGVCCMWRCIIALLCMCVSSGHTEISYLPHLKNNVNSQTKQSDLIRLNTQAMLSAPDRFQYLVLQTQFKWHQKNISFIL